MSTFDGGMLLLGLVLSFAVTLVLVATLPHAAGRRPPRDPRRRPGGPSGPPR